MTDDDIMAWDLANPIPADIDDLDGVDLIAAARDKQRSEHGWSTEHDAQHTERELLRAAAVMARLRRPDFWPWPDTAPPLSELDRVGDLATAGALIAAEIDRMLAAGERA